MKSVLRGLASASSLLASKLSSGSFIDSLIQTFENCRPGLSDEVILQGEQEVEKYFLQLFEKELPRLKNAIKVQEGSLSGSSADKLTSEILELIRDVVIPAYSRVAYRYTPRERDDFYLVSEHYRFLERAGWAIAGILVGAFVVWAPFIPLWSKEWILPFMIAGAIFPNLRRFYSVKYYERDLNRIVSKADREIGRMEISYLTEEGERSVEEGPEKEEMFGDSAREQRRKEETRIKQ